MITSKCLVTGGAGFIGSHLTEYLLKEGHEVVVLDSFDDYYTKKLQNLDPLKKYENFKLIKGNILDLELVKKLMQDIDYVFHNAAQAGVRISVRDPFKSNNVNVNGTLNILYAAKESNVKKVINASSSSVYGNTPYLPMKEEHTPIPMSPYGVSKLAAEKYCEVFQDVYGLKTISLRYFTVYGPRQRPDMAIRIFVDTLLQNKPIIIFGNGEQTRDFTNIFDVIDANIRCMKSSATGVFNIGCGRNISVNELGKVILEIMGKDVEPIYEKAQLGDAPHTWADNSKALEILGWKPRITIKEGIEKFVKWYEPRADELREIVN